MINHYKWLEENLLIFRDNLNISEHRMNLGVIRAHGDKCSQYHDKWEKARIPFCHGVAIYFLIYYVPWDKEIRCTKNGWVDPCGWVIDNYKRFLPYLPKAY